MYILYIFIFGRRNPSNYRRTIVRFCFFEALLSIGDQPICYVPILDPIESQFHSENLPNFQAKRGALLRGYEAHWCPFTKPSEIFILGDLRRGGILKGHDMKHKSYIVFALF